MAEYIQAKQGKIFCKTGIVKVDTASRLATTSAGGVIRYRELVWAADAKAMYKAAVSPLPVKKQYARQAGKVARAHGGNSVLTVFLALDVPPADVEQAFGAHFLRPAPQAFPV